MSAIMKSLNWPNNNTYVNITPHPHISIWHVQPATSKSLIITISLCCAMHARPLMRGQICTACSLRQGIICILKDSWVAHECSLDGERWCKRHAGCAYLSLKFLCSVFSFAARVNSDVTRWPNVMPSCDPFSPSTLKLVMSPCAFPV